MEGSDPSCDRGNGGGGGGGSTVAPTELLT